MPTRQVTQQEGRRAFGEGARNYDSARPEYPAGVYALLSERCGLRPGCATFEIGPGTGLATRRLIEAGANPLVAVEPDARLAAVLSERSPAAEVLIAPFEDASLPEHSFDLGASATAFHWVDQTRGLTKVASLLKPGGWWAMWWNVFGDDDRYDAFHEATKELLSPLGGSPTQAVNWQHPFPMDCEARFADLLAVGAFAELGVEILKWTLILDTQQTRALYATFSQITTLEPAERERVLDELAHIAQSEFAGRVERNMCTPVYTARRL
jgi:SAM-dependent methyltransferase